MKKLPCLCLALAGALSALAGTEIETTSSQAQTDENSLNLILTETTYTFQSDFEESRLGKGDSLYNDFNYDHRFLITGKWYFRAGVEYERYDFDNSGNGLPNHLQAFSGHLAIEYVVKDFPAVSLELDPGAYFENRVTEDAFDIPVKAFVTFPIQKDKIYGVIGLGAAIYQDPVVAPGGGIIWLISDKLRAQVVFPRPALIYTPNDDWEFRILGELNYTSFRTDDISGPPRGFNLHNAVVQYNEDRAGVQAAYSGFKPFRIIASGGCTVTREFDFFRADEKARAEPAPYVRFSLEAHF